MAHFVSTEISAGVATVHLSRGKVNALHPETISELSEAFSALEKDDDVRAVVLTGQGAFFSFGFDVPHLLSYPRIRFSAYLKQFTDFYLQLFLFGKPVVAAVNGHAVAGGCMLALACDRRLMATGRGKIGLNEIAFGSTIFAGMTEILRFAVGDAAAAEILYSGKLYSAEEAATLGLVHDAVAGPDLAGRAFEVASHFASRYPPAFASLKQLLRGPAGDKARQCEQESIDAFIDIWYSESTRAKLKNIVIR